MKKYTILRHKDDEAGFYYNALGERFFPYTDAMINCLTTNTPIVEYDTNRTTFVTVEREYHDELIEVQVECFIILNAFNSIEEAVTYETASLLLPF